MERRRQFAPCLVITSRIPNGFSNSARIMATPTGLPFAFMCS